MSRIPLHVSVGALLVLAGGPGGASAAQRPAQVRVVNAPAPVLRWFNAKSDVVTELDRGATLDVLDEDTGWFWVILPPDAHGTRRPGWIRVTDVEPVVSTAATQGDAVAAAADSAAPAAGPEPVPADDKVSISVRRDDAPGSDPAAAATARVRSFEDVHFDRDRDELRPEDVPALRAAAAALKSDPSLVVNIEGYTCNLGSTVHNLALGARRANSVKTFLVSEGVPAERLHTVSRGEGNAQYDNSREETRRLNRRVTLVPDAQQ